MQLVKDEKGGREIQLPPKRGQIKLKIIGKLAQSTAAIATSIPAVREVQRCASFDKHMHAYGATDAQQHYYCPRTAGYNSASDVSANSSPATLSDRCPLPRHH